MDETAARKTCWVAAMHSVEAVRPLLPARLPEAADGGLADQFDRLSDAHRELRNMDSLPGTPGWLPWLLPAIGLCAGLATNAFAQSGRINLISFPVLGLVIWNLAVYLLLLFKAAQSRQPVNSFFLEWLMNRIRQPNENESQTDSSPIPWPQIREKFLSLWLPQSRVVVIEHIKTNLHLAAAAAAMGVVAGMYVRGLAFEYRAGWSSTFLNGQSLESFLHFTLGPAAWFAGIELPDSVHLDSLSWSGGSKGENAASWIHLYAVTCLLFIGLPRLLLALGSAGKARSFRANFPLDLNALGLTPEPDVALEDSSNPKAKQICVIPFNLDLESKDRELIRLFAFGEAGGPVNIDYRAKVDYAEIEEYFTSFRPATRDAFRTVLLFNLSSTPEHEVQGDAIRHLQEHIPQERLLIYLDGDAFTKRFSADPDFQERLRTRKESWANFLKTYDAKPVFMRADT